MPSNPQTTIAPSTVPTGVTNRVSPNTQKPSSSTDQVLASGSFRRLVSAVKECVKYEAIYNDVEGTQDRLSHMELEISAKNADTEKQKCDYERLMDTHETRLIMWTRQKEALKAAEEELQEKLKEERKKTKETNEEEKKLKRLLRQKETELIDLGRELKNEKKKSSNLKEELETTQSASITLNVKLTKYEKSLQKWETYDELLQEVNVDDFSSDMHKLWARFQDLAERNFFMDVSSGLLTDNARWDNLTQALKVSSGTLPLPPRNSVAAKQIRMAAALAVLADRIIAYIFAPVYIPAANEDIRQLLMLHADEDSRKEAVCRALLLSASTEDENQQAAAKLVLDVANDVNRILSPLLGPSMIEPFGAELHALVHDAMILWWRAQRSSIKIEASIEDVEGWKWDDLSIFKNTGENTAFDSLASATTIRNSRMIPLFPRVMVVHEDELRLVFPGVAVWDWQTLAAEQELRECVATRRSRALRGSGSNGGGLRRDRRMSIADGYGSAAVHSPTNSMIPSFLDQGKLGGGRGDG